MNVSATEIVRNLRVLSNFCFKRSFYCFCMFSVYLMQVQLWPCDVALRVILPKMDTIELLTDHAKILTSLENLSIIKLVSRDPMNSTTRSALRRSTISLYISLLFFNLQCSHSEENTYIYTVFEPRPSGVCGWLDGWRAYSRVIKYSWAYEKGMNCVIFSDYLNEK